MDLKHDEKEVTANIRETETDGLRSWMIRLVERGSVDVDKIESYSITEGNVDITYDLDGSGQLIGIQLTVFKKEFDG